MNWIKLNSLKKEKLTHVFCDSPLYVFLVLGLGSEQICTRKDIDNLDNPRQHSPRIPLKFTNNIEFDYEK